MKLIRLGLIPFALAALTVSAVEKPPKLVVAIVVDQLRADYLERLQPHFVEGGFAWLLKGGAHLTAAHFDYAPTTTAPGHASIFSGATPSHHGIIGNDWFDRRTKKMAYCVGDPFATGVGTLAKAGQMSPRNLVGSSFADQMRLHYGSKVVGISMKDRSAILPAGKRPVGAYWFEAATGNFITSDFYATALPAWVRDFNARKLAAGFIGQKWERLLDAQHYPGSDDGPGEGLLAGEKKPVFPHTIALPQKDPLKERDAYENVLASPFSNELLAAFAQAAIEGERLGEGSGPDLLTVSFSAVDSVGHRYGPDSHEVRDIMLRLDRQLAKFFDFLGKKIGLDNLAFILTADHGVAPTPEFAAAQGLGGERVNEQALVSDLQARLSERFQNANILLAKGFFDGQLFLNHDVLSAAKLAPVEVFAFVRDWALATGKFQAVFSREQLLEGRAPGRVGERIARGYHAERGGDAVLVYKPFVLEYGTKTGTTHGSPYAYDTHVPVIFHGAAFKPGRYADEFAITDLAATFCAALRITPPPLSMGRVCVKVLSEQR